MDNVLNSSDTKWASALLELQVYICMTTPLSAQCKLSVYGYSDILLNESLHDYSNFLLSATSLQD